MFLSKLLRMDGREIKGSGDRGFLKGTKMYRVRNFVVFGGIIYTIVLTAIFVNMESSKKLYKRFDDLDSYFRSKQLKNYEEILEKRIERNKKYQQLHEDDKMS
ncbi:hypothetical protein Ahia01_001010500 [Argonauta hians]